MATIVTRAGKGSPLTHTEVDANFTNLNDEAATKAPLASPALTGTPTAPTATVGTNTTQVATTAFVNAEIANDAPTKTGGGASGTWGINITGGSATATNLSTDRTNWSTNGTISAVVGQLAWKNYGNNHTIFDASQSTSPNGGGVNNTNAQNAWTGTYPTLMGWNGSQTYGVRVDSARVADIAGSVSPPAYGSVGSYAFLVFRGPAFLSAGTNIAGSSLIPGGVYGNTIVADNSVANANGSALSTGSGALGGTWQAVGAVTFSSGSSFSRGTVFLRIS